MNTWFEVKVKYTKQLPNGAFKRVSEPYLLAAMTFSDAEGRIYEELGEIIRGEFTITNISRSNLHDVFHYEDSDVWWKMKVVYEGATEDSDKPKKITQNFLLSADNANDAEERMRESLSGLMVDFEITGVLKTKIVDVFPYNEELDKEISRKPMMELMWQTTDEEGNKQLHHFPVMGSEPVTAAPSNRYVPDVDFETADHMPPDPTDYDDLEDELP